VVHGLEVPEPLPGRRVQRQQGVGVEVVAEAVGAVEIGGGRPGRHEDDAARHVDRHAGPVVGAAAGLAPADGPGLGAGLTGGGDGPEGPPDGAGPHVDGPDVARRGRQAFVDAPADDQQIAVDGAWRREPHRLEFRRPAEAFVQIDPAVAPERRDRLAGGRVQRVDEAIDGGEDPRRPAVRPVGDPTVRATALHAGVERPAERPGRRVEGDGPVMRRRRVERPADDDRVGLQPTVLAGVVGPGDLQARHVGAGDPGQRGMADPVRAAAVGRPVAPGRWRGDGWTPDGCRGQAGHPGHQQGVAGDARNVQLNTSTITSGALILAAPVGGWCGSRRAGSGSS
jgi:hypothetical protein